MDTNTVNIADYPVNYVDPSSSTEGGVQDMRMFFEILFLVLYVYILVHLLQICELIF